MTLEKLHKDYIIAMKENQSIKKDVLRNVISSIKKVAIDKRLGDNITEQIVDEVLLKEKKILQEQIDTCPEARVELREIYLGKMIYLNEYAPKLITNEDEIEEYINYIIDNYDVDISNTNSAMKSIMPYLKGKCDMKIASSVIKGMCF